MKELMKKTGLAIIIAMFSSTLPAQPPGGERGNKIESLRIAFISQRLNLTPEEAQKFWPVYNQYHNELKKLRDAFGLGPDKPKLTAEQSLDFEQKKLDLKKSYKTQFESAIGKEKVNALYNIEEEFRQKLRELREERNQHKGQGPPPGKRF